MNKENYLSTLKKELEACDVPHTNGVLRYYDDLFTQSRLQGITEDEVATTLGPPKAVAQAYVTNPTLVQQKSSERPSRLKNFFFVSGRLLILAPFSLVLITLPGLVVLAALVALWVLFMFFFAAGITAALVGLSTSVVPMTFWLICTISLVSLFLIFLSLSGSLLLWKITKSYFMFLFDYIRWNLSFVSSKREPL